jgi:hypothetical protein
VILHHNDVGLAVLCYILACIWGVRGVDAHCKPTGNTREKQYSELCCLYVPSNSKKIPFLQTGLATLLRKNVVQKVMIIMKEEDNR